ncbi:hypothetical protein AURDEDRAFT_122576 [Auricularia subglabra TFB-10046 SS5]|nr:hypothetical protein AURDEDRAFT_122576 [Auricularia subglabra TFB-10046 SS5]
MVAARISSIPAEALRTWTLAALDSGRTSQGGHDGLDLNVPADIHSYTSAGIQQLVRSALMRVAGECNRHSALIALPAALLRRIFDFVRCDDRWALSQTCRDLRTSCLATPTLWRTLPPRRDWQPGRLTANFVNQLAVLAARSIPEELDFRVPYHFSDTTDETASLAVAVLKPLLPRLRFLTLWSISFEQWGHFCELLESPAPALEDAQIHASYESAERTPMLPSGLFAGSREGRLRALDLQHIQLPSAGRMCDALRNVRSFKWEARFIKVVGPTELCRILSLMPRLETLILFVDDFIWSDTDVELPVSCCLQSFELAYTRKFVNGFRCLRNLHTVSCFTCNLSRGTPALFLDAIAAYPLQAFVGPRQSEIVVQQENRTHSLTILGDADNIGVNYWGWDSEIAIYPTVAGSLTSLSLHENHWPATDPVPPFPNLRWLRLLLAACSDHVFAFRNPLLEQSTEDCILAQWDLPRWTAPVLETLLIAHAGSPHVCRQLTSDIGVNSFDLAAALGVALISERRLASCYCSKPIAVSLADIHRFTTTYILQPGQRLARIELQGVEVVDVDPCPSLALLELVAASVTISRSHERMSCDGASQRRDDGDWIF